MATKKTPTKKSRKLTPEQLEKRRADARQRKEDERRWAEEHAAREAAFHASRRKAAEELARDEAESEAWMNDYERRIGKAPPPTENFINVTAGESLAKGEARYERRRVQAEEALAAGDCSSHAVQVFFDYLKERSDDSRVMSWGGGMKARVFQQERDAFKRRILAKCNISLQGLKRRR